MSKGLYATSRGGGGGLARRQLQGGALYPGAGVPNCNFLSYPHHRHLLPGMLLHPQFLCSACCLEWHSRGRKRSRSHWRQGDSSSTWEVAPVGSCAHWPGPEQLRLFWVEEHHGGSHKPDGRKGGRWGMGEEQTTTAPHQAKPLQKALLHMAPI